MIKDLKVVNDGFYGDALILSEISISNQVLRVALVSKNGQQGIDLRKFSSKGKPTTGILLTDKNAINQLKDILNDTTLIEAWLGGQDIDFSIYNKMEEN